MRNGPDPAQPAKELEIIKVLYENLIRTNPDSAQAAEETKIMKLLI